MLILRAGQMSSYIITPGNGADFIISPNQLSMWLCKQRKTAYIHCPILSNWRESIRRVHFYLMGAMGCLLSLEMSYVCVAVYTVWVWLLWVFSNVVALCVLWHYLMSEDTHMGWALWVVNSFVMLISAGSKNGYKCASTNWYTSDCEKNKPTNIPGSM